MLNQILQEILSQVRDDNASDFLTFFQLLFIYMEDKKHCRLYRYTALAYSFPICLNAQTEKT